MKPIQQRTPLLTDFCDLAVAPRIASFLALARKASLCAAVGHSLLAAMSACIGVKPSESLFGCLSSSRSFSGSFGAHSLTPNLMLWHRRADLHTSNKCTPEQMRWHVTQALDRIKLCVTELKSTKPLLRVLCNLQLLGACKLVFRQESSNFSLIDWIWQRKRAAMGGCAA